MRRKLKNQEAADWRAYKEWQRRNNPGQKINSIKEFREISRTPEVRKVISNTKRQLAQERKSWLSYKKWQSKYVKKNPEFDAITSIEQFREIYNSKGIDRRVANMT